VSPRALGPRQAARVAQRRRRRRLGLVTFFGATAAVAALIVGAAWLGKQFAAPSEKPTPTSSASPVAEQEQDTLLLVRDLEDDGPAAGVTLFAVQEGGRSTILFIPVGTLVDIPGFGLDRLALAEQYGGPALVVAAVENLLGIDIDHVATASQSALATFVGRTGGMELEIKEQLVARAPDGTAEIRFEPGVQFLDGQRLVEYWSFQQRGEQELSSFPRQQLVLSHLMDELSDQKVLEALVGDGAPQLDTTASPRFLAEMLQELAAAYDDDRADFTLLPVSPFGSDNDGGSSYRATEDGIEQLATGPLAPSVPRGGGSEAIRVQILNGVGTPGVGLEVDRRLEGTGVRIVLTDNARNFDFTETLILIYDDSERSQQAAEMVRRRLGVGTIQLSRQPQSVVDLTIVVGADFPPASEPGEEPSEEQST
jgi:hypothetical protein